MAPAARALLAATCCAVIALSFAAPLNSSSVADGPTNICGLNATIGASVVAALNLTYPGLEDVAAAVKAGDLNTACEALATYYRTSNTASWLRMPAPAPGTGMAGGYADDIVLHDTFWLAGVTVYSTPPRNADGGLDWLYKGPRDDPEAMNCLNRHDSFVYLLQAWNTTGNLIYSDYFNALVQDWVLHLPCQNSLGSGTSCVPLGLPGETCTWTAPLGSQTCKTGTMESPWRSLEMGIRMGGQWPTAFFGMQNAPEFSTSARVLMVLAVAEHMQALVEDGGHPGRGTPNWEMTQWQGLVYATVAWPEIAGAQGYQSYGLKQLDAIMAAGVYPDGVETEQASGYDMGTAADFWGTLFVLANGNTGVKPPQNFTDRVEAMWNYGAMVSDPRGCLPRNGDADLCNSGFNPAVTAYFNRSDWLYVHTNGAQGTVPPQAATQGPSTIFPWAGQVVLRSGYDVDATWVWFDIGPYGSSGHAHRDKLNLLLHARGSMLLVDSGRFAYAGDDLSATLHQQYASFTGAHNTFTIDGCDQQAFPALATSPVDNSTYSFTKQSDTVHGSMTYYENLTGTAMHSRGVYYQRQAGWMDAEEGSSTSTGSTAGDDGDWLVVFDSITSDRPRTVQTTWHTHPNASGVALDPSTHVAVVGGVDYATGQPTTAQVCVIPATGGAVTPWANATIIAGQYKDDKSGAPWQGWYSQSYDDAWPSQTLVYNAQVGSAGPSSAYFAWLLIPSSTRGPCTGSSLEVLSVTGGKASVQVTLAGQAPVTVTVPFQG